ncbi:hypothetical protein F2Q69_00029788 [Brassica cretica]|uniref:Uncharacterized protein n=1 Tax=Brassica cretica TaxID=69181 RepID=A0A8S9RYT8_BRACR|nr:hypothetical protein F2Q69_00029788 [Brassica cretica]
MESLDLDLTASASATSGELTKSCTTVPCFVEEKDKSEKIHANLVLFRSLSHAVFVLHITDLSSVRYRFRILEQSESCAHNIASQLIYANGAAILDPIDVAIMQGLNVIRHLKTTTDLISSTEMPRNT